MKTVRYLIPLLLVGYLATGFYIVGPDEQAVVKRFGKARFAIGTEFRPFDQTGRNKTNLDRTTRR